MIDPKTQPEPPVGLPDYFDDLNINPLTDEQKKHWSALHWLYSDAKETRRRGRTYLQALVLLDKALNNPGQPVMIQVDHAGHQAPHIELRRLLEHIVNHSPIAGAIEFGTGVIRSVPCAHCKMGYAEHVRGKCLYDHSHFTPERQNEAELAKLRAQLMQQQSMQQAMAQGWNPPPGASRGLGHADPRALFGGVSTI